MIFNDAAIDDVQDIRSLELSSNLLQPLVPGYEVIKIQELVIGTWHIWWLRRHRTLGGEIPLMRNCANSIRAIYSCECGTSKYPDSSCKDGDVDR
jgi:hypothetical protein